MKIYDTIFGRESFEFNSKYDKEKTIHFIEQTLFASKEITGIQLDGDFKIWSTKLHPIYKYKFRSPNFVIEMSMKNIEESSKIVGVVKMDDVIDLSQGFGIFMSFFLFGFLLIQPEMKIIVIILLQIILFFGVLKINRSCVNKGIYELDKIRSLLESQPNSV